MKKTIKIAFFLAFLLGPCKLAMAEEIPAGDSNLTVQTTVNNNSQDIEENTKVEEEAKCPSTVKVSEVEKANSTEEKKEKSESPAKPAIASIEKEKVEQSPQPEVSAPSSHIVGSSADERSRSLRNRGCRSYANPYHVSRREANESTIQAEIESARPKINDDKFDAHSSRSKGFIDTINNASKEVTKKNVTVINSDQENKVNMPSHRSFTSNIQSAMQTAQNAKITSVHYNITEEQKYRERDLRERQLRQREWNLREHENRLRHRDYHFSEQDRAFRDREWCDRQLQLLDWQDISARDAELRYLLWRERQMNKYYWLQNGQMCRYITVYKTGSRINKRVTICEIRHGVRVCYHPRRYFIFPMTKLICVRNDRPILRTVVHPYDY